MVTVNTNWWREPKNKAHESAIAHLNALLPSRSSFRARYVDALATYRNTVTTNSSNLGALASSALQFTEPTRWNVVASVVDTLHARIASRKARPKFSLEGATRWESREHARLLDRFFSGIYQQTKAYDCFADAFFDSLVAGFGAVHCFVDGDEVCIERVSPLEVVIDDRYTAKPRTLYRVKNVPSEVLIALYPKKKAEIEQVTAGQERYDGQFKVVEEEVQVVEAWHLPPGKGHAGRHVICIDKATLLDEDWNHNFFPIQFIHYSPEPDLFYKQSLVERLRPLQRELNRMTERMQDAVRLNATNWLLYRDQSVDADKFTNLPGSKIPVNNTHIGPLRDAIDVVTPPSMPSQVFDYIERLKQAIYDFSPIGEPDATSRVPTGLESGKALRVHNEIGGLRLQRMLQRYESLSVDVTYSLVELVKAAHSSGSKVKTQFESDDLLEVIPWSKVKLNGSFVIKVYPINAMSETPSAKIEDANKLIQLGVIKDTATIAQHFDFADIEGITEMESASRRNIQRLVEEILRTGEYTPPSGFMDLPLAITIATQVTNLAMSMGCPPDRIELAERFISDCTDLLAPEPPAMPDPAGAEAMSMLGGMPGGMPAEMTGGLNIAPVDPGALQQ